MTHIRRGTKEDVSLLLALTRASFAESRSFPFPSSALKGTPEDAAAAILGGTVLGYEGDSPVGACRYRLEGSALVFTRLCVLPARRGRGHAGRI